MRVIVVVGTVPGNHEHGEMPAKVREGFRNAGFFAVCEKLLRGFDII